MYATAAPDVPLAGDYFQALRNIIVVRQLDYYAGARV